VVLLVRDHVAISPKPAHQVNHVRTQSPMTPVA